MVQNKKRGTVIVIGAGFSGLSAAAHLSQQGFDVTILEKHAEPGGRARMMEIDGFRFDMGPSWYWMPDVFDTWFERFGSRTKDHYDLVRLAPSYRVFFPQSEQVDVPADLGELKSLFESIEPGSGKSFDTFVREAEYKYRVGMQDLVYKPGLSLLEYVDWRVIRGIFKLQMFRSMSTYVRSLFRDPRLIQLLEFPVLFLGARPQKIPAMYSMMNYADMALGTWYPKGGMNRIVEGMVRVVEGMGVDIRCDEEVVLCRSEKGRITSVETAKGSYSADVVVAAADYHHVEQRLLTASDRQYSKEYWKGRTMAPSSLIYYVGLNTKLNNVLHHNLFFDRSFDAHAIEIYENPKYPTDPLFYLCVPSKTDSTVAPDGCENLFILIPTAPGIEDTSEIRDKYFEMVMERIEERSGQRVRDAVILRKDFAHNDFVREYNSFQGNAYGLANTLRQTAVLKPRLKSKKLSNLYYCGQLTVPGPGVPPSLVSGKVVTDVITRSH